MSYSSGNKIRFVLKEVILNQNMFQHNNFLGLGCSNKIDTDKMRTALKCCKYNVLDGKGRPRKTLK